MPPSRTCSRRSTATPPMRRPTSTSPTSLALTLGGRYTQGQEGRLLRPASPIPSWRRSRAPEALTFPDVDDERFTYRLGLNYEPNEDLLFFATYSTGYKSAGYNSGGGCAVADDRSMPQRQPRSRPTRVFDRETIEELRARRQDQLAGPQADREPHPLPDGHQRLPGPRVRRHQLHRPQRRQSAPAGLRVRRRRQADAQPVAVRQRRLPRLRVHRLSRTPPGLPGLRRDAGPEGQAGHLLARSGAAASASTGPAISARAA